MNLFSVIVISAVLAWSIARSWLAWRQIRHVQHHREQVPAAFADTIPLAAHRKAADYTTAKTRLAFAHIAVDVLILLGWTFGGGLTLLDDAWRSLPLPELATGIGVILSALLISGLLELPLSYFQTFVVEERFGFNRMTPKLFFSDALKGGLVMLLLGTPLLALILYILQRSGEFWWLYAWAAWMGFSLLLTWAYPTFIAPLFNTFQPLEDEPLRRRIHDLLARCGFSSKGVFVMDGSRRSSHGNAYFTGFGKNKRIVFFDTLLKQLEADQIEAVLAHELGHFRRHHIRKNLLWAGSLSLLALFVLGWLMQQPAFYQGLGVETPSPYMGLMLFILISPVFGFFLKPVLSQLSRRYEFEADAFAAEHAEPRSLISALLALYEDNAATLTPDPLYSLVYDSHPPASVRIKHLSTMLSETR